MKKDTLIEFIKSEIVRFADENALPLCQITDTTRFVGPQGIFNTLDMLAFGLELDDTLVEKFNLHAELTSDYALSQHKNPFISPESLASYLMDQIQSPFSLQTGS